MIKPPGKCSGKRPGTLVAVLLAVYVIAAFADSPETRAAGAPYDADSGSVLVRCGALIDGRSDEVMKDASVLIEKGRFSRVATQLETPPGVEILDLAEYTCLPGLIDMHTHMLESFEELVDLTLYYGYTHEDNMKAGRKYSQLSIGAGFTTVRSLGNYYGWVDRDLRDEINRGDTVGPRLQASGFYLTIPGGGGDLLGHRSVVSPDYSRIRAARPVWSRPGRRRPRAWLVVLEPLHSAGGALDATIFERAVVRVIA